MMAYKPFGFPCYEHGDCDVDLYCKRDGSESGTCSLCLNNQACPDKTFSPKLSNWATCKYGDNNCPDYCVGLDGKCWTTDPKMGKCCCRLKCNEKGHCVDDNCKKVGTCTDDDDICPEYGCLQGTVVYAAGQKYNTRGGRRS